MTLMTATVSADQSVIAPCALFVNGSFYGQSEVTGGMSYELVWPKATDQRTAGSGIASWIEMPL